MKILWVNSNFMHPTTKGGQIRTMEMLRYLHRWHEIHYVALENPSQPEGPARAGEYSFRAYPFRYSVPDKTSFQFLPQLIKGTFSKVPLAISRFVPSGMRRFLEELIRREGFDAAVVDHLAPMGYFPDRAHSLLFQHNVEFMIWRRHVQHTTDPLRRWYFQIQADRMFEFERAACRESGHVVACSEADAGLMRESFAIPRISHISTGVNIEYFAPPEDSKSVTSRPDFAFIGSMDWLANQQAVFWFVREILPLIRKRRPQATFAVVGRTPPPSVLALAAKDPLITVTGTVPDVRPWFWESGICVVPLLVGGGTRLKIYEAMAARSPVVSTAIGAEGLEYTPGENIRIADTAADFADQCLDLVGNGEERRKLTTAAWEMVSANYSWESVSRQFDSILQQSPGLTKSDGQR